MDENEMQAAAYLNQFRMHGCKYGATGQFIKRLHQRLMELEYPEAEIAFLLTLRERFIVVLRYNQQQEAVAYPDVDAAMDAAEKIFNVWRDHYDQARQEAQTFIETHNIEDELIDKWLDLLSIWEHERQFKRNWHDYVRSNEYGTP